MKRLIGLFLALLMAVAVVGGAGSCAWAEEENPYVGLWEVTGGQDGETQLSIEEAEGRTYMYFLPNGAVYGVVIDGEYIEDAYAAYRMTGENALELLSNGETVPGTFDPDTGVITLTYPVEKLLVFLERVKADPLPDIWAMADHSDEERTYYGYKTIYSDMTIDLLETLPAAGVDPHDFYLTLAPDGTGHMSFGQKDAVFEITWTEDKIIPVISPEEPMAYTRQEGHIYFHMEGGATVEFVPEGEAEVLLAASNAAVHALDATDLVGEWRLVKADDDGELLTAEQLQGEGLTMFCFRFNEDGTASMTTNGTTTPGLNWALEGGKVTLTYASQPVFTLTYDGEYLILPIMATLYFEKVN